MTVAEAIIKSLKKAGVEYAFGVPGGPWLPYQEVMRKEGIRYVLVGNEATASFMADVCARVTGVPAICHGTFGPGATNLSTGVGGALLDRFPLIAITSEIPDAMVERVTQMNIDHQQVFAPITKWTTRMNTSNVLETMKQALEIALEEVQGSVHIGVPSDLANKEIEVDIDNFEIQVKEEKEPNASDLENIIDTIKNANKPILAIGLTAARKKLGKELLELVNKLQIPFAITPMARGILPENHPLYTGVLFHALSEQMTAIHGQSNLVIGLGYDPIEFNYEPWVNENCPIVHIDTSTTEVSSSHQLAHQAIGNFKASLDYLNQQNFGSFDWNLEEIKSFRTAFFKNFEPQTNKFGPIEALHSLRESLPDDAIMTCDVGAHTHLVGQMWRTPATGLQLMTNGWSSMGFAIPSAMAAKLCKPETDVVCVTGDGGFLMMCGELVTALRENINMIVVVLADKQLSLMDVKQQWQELPTANIDLYEGELFRTDDFLGVPVKTVNNMDEMKEAIIVARQASTPYIISANIDGSDYHRLVSRKYK